VSRVQPGLEELQDEAERLLRSTRITRLPAAGDGRAGEIRILARNARRGGRAEAAAALAEEPS
jgi:hypothetical protein